MLGNMLGWAMGAVCTRTKSEAVLDKGMHECKLQHKAQQTATREIKTCLRTSQLPLGVHAYRFKICPTLDQSQSISLVYSAKSSPVAVAPMAIYLAWAPQKLCVDHTADLDQVVDCWQQ